MRSTPSEERSLFRLAAPLVVSFWMRSLFTFVDTLYASSIGDSAIAAIGLTVPLEFLLIATWVGLSNALTSNLSKALGAGELGLYDQYRRSMRRLVAVVIPGFVAISFGIRWAIPHLGLESATAREFAIYGPVLLGGSALTAFWSIIPDSIVKAHHDTTSTMIAGILSNLTNVGLNTLFLFAFGWGIFGIAFSTVLGRLAGLAYASVRARALDRAWRSSNLVARVGEGPHPYRALLFLAVPGALAFLLTAAETGLVNYLASGLADSTAAIAAFSIYLRLYYLAIMPFIATAAALLPFAARHFGAGDLALVRRSQTRALLAGAGYACLIVGPATYFVGPPLVSWLSELPQTTTYATWSLVLLPLITVAEAPFLLARPIFEGMQRGAPGVILAVVRHLFLAFPLAVAGFRLAGTWGLDPYYGILGGIVAAHLLAGALFFAWSRFAMGAGSIAARSSRG